MKINIKHNVLIILILLLALGLRLISINQSLWLDEATSALVARMGIGQILEKFIPGDFHPPLYYIILHFWSAIFGFSEPGLRSLSVFIGVLSVYLMFILTSTVSSKRIGYIAALLLATSGLHIYFSQEARMYVLASFFVLIGVLFFVKTLGVEKGSVYPRCKNLYWFLFSIFLALSFFTHYLTVMMVGVYWFYTLLYVRDKSWWKRFLASHIIIIITILLWIPIMVKQMKIGIAVSDSAPLWWSTLGKTSLKEISLVPVKFMLGRISFQNNYLYALIILVTSTIIGFLMYKALSKKNILVWLWLVVPILLAALLGTRISIFSYFRLLYVLPALYLLIALGIGRLEKYKIIALVITCINLATTSMYLLDKNFHREDWRGLVSYVNSNIKDSSAVFFVTDNQTEAYKFYDPDAKIAGPSGLNGSYNQIWLMRYVQPIFDPGDSLRVKIVDLGYKKQGEYDFNGIVVWEYRK